MTKGVRLFIYLCVTFFITPSYSQFYDVKQVHKISSISTITENSDKQIFSKERPLPVLDTVQVTKDSKAHIHLNDSIINANLLCPPLDTLVVTSGYGYRTDPFSGKRKFHHGTDFASSADNVYSMMPGKVRKIGYNKVLGNYIELDHGDFTVTYAHLHTVIGEKGDFVRAGQSVGITGNTGRSTGEHLHLSMRYKNKSVDPYPRVLYIANWARSLLVSLP